MRAPEAMRSSAAFFKELVASTTRGSRSSACPVQRSRYFAGNGARLEDRSVVEDEGGILPSGVGEKEHLVQDGLGEILLAEREFDEFLQGEGGRFDAEDGLARAP